MFNDPLAASPAPGVDGDAPPWSRTPAAVTADLATDPTLGLATDEASRRLAAGGANVLPKPERSSALARFAAQLRSWLAVVLMVAAALAVVVGEPVDAAVIVSVLLLNATMGIVQEGRAERSIATLEGWLATRARVRRDGRLLDVDATELVVGDVVTVDAGDRIPADGRWVSATALAIDESSLTGESNSVTKNVEVSLARDTPVAERSTMGWMNTTVVRGRGWLVVTATGTATQVGRVAILLAEATPRPTPLQRQLDGLGRRVVVVAGLAVAAVLALALIRGDRLLDAVLQAIALAVAAIPEGLPAVVTLTLALGGAAMARRRAIVRRLSSVETLGSTEVICTDKTGTLTRNEMTATVLWRAGTEHTVIAGDGPTTSPKVGTITPDPGDLQRLVGAMVRCNDAEVVEGRLIGDPTEGALLTLAATIGADVAGLRSLARTQEVPFDGASKLMATSHRGVEGAVLVEVKGAPDVLLERCSQWVGPGGDAPLEPAERRRIQQAVTSLAGRGLRTLAVATRQLRPESPEARLPLAQLLGGLTLEAVVGIVDPPRPGVAEAIATANRAGIRVVMITGDHPATAVAIADQVGIGGDVLTGRELDALDDASLAARIDDIGVCARVAPEHKVRLVQALQANGRVVAMTGDGVNDAPALEHADIGVAMGIAGTDVTRQAADLVLADDDFSTIVVAVEHGRAIYDNILAFIRFQLATNLGAIVTILVAGLAGLPTPFTAIQLLWVNIIMDGPPALALGVDPARRDTMLRPPRGTGSQLLDTARLGRVALSAAVMAAGTLGVLAAAGRAGLPTGTATSWAFTAFVFFQVANALNARSERISLVSRHTLTNRPLWAALVAVVGLQVAGVHLPAVAGVLDTSPLTPRQWVIAVLVASSVVFAEELRKAVTRARERSPRSRPSRAGRPPARPSVSAAPRRSRRLHAGAGSG